MELYQVSSMIKDSIFLCRKMGSINVFCCCFFSSFFSFFLLFTDLINF